MRELKRLVRTGCAAAAVAACASPGVPPGGPIDTAAPQILRIAPDSGRTGVTPRDVIFRFDEVVSERPTAGPTLESLFLISPRRGAPRVDWSREEVAVRPRGGWRPNTTYTVTLLPGITDLRGNTRNIAASTVFSTGPTIARSRVSGNLFNWTLGSVAPRGYIEAISRADTTVVYVASTDSTGTFVFPNLVPGAYLLRGIIDENNNRGLDPREAWDSVAVALADSSRVELLAFVHDSAGARLSSVAVEDSVTLRLNFDGPIDPGQPITPAIVRVRAADSTDVTVTSVAPPPRDTTAAAPARAPSRPSPPTSLDVRLGRPLRAGTEYRVRVIDVRNLMGVARSSERTVDIPAPAPPPAARDTSRTTPPPAPPAAPIRR